MRNLVDNGDSFVDEQPLLPMSRVFVHVGGEFVSRDVLCEQTDARRRRIPVAVRKNSKRVALFADNDPEGKNRNLSSQII